MGEIIDVLDGETSSGLTLIDLRMDVLSGGYVLDTTIGKNGQLLVYDGGKASGTTIQKGGQMYVYGTGTADEITVQKGGQILGYGNKSPRILKNVTVESGGSVRAGDLVGGSMDVLPGGRIAENTIGDGGRLYLSGKADTFTFISSDGVAYIDGGGSVYRPSVLSGGTMYVNSGGSAKEATAGVGGSIFVFSGGKVNSARIEHHASMYIYTGGTATKIDWTPGAGIVHADPGATVTFAGKYSGIYYGSNGYFVDQTGPNNRKIGDNASMYVMSRGEADGYTVTGTGQMFVHSGGVTETLTVDSNGQAYVSSGGIASAAKLKNNGRLYVEYKGLARDTQIQMDGSLVVYSAGTATMTSVENGGWLDVRDDSVISGADVAKGGRMDVLSATLAGRTLIRKGGSMRIWPETKLSGQIILKDGAVATLESNAGIVFEIGTGSTLGGGAPTRINALSSINGWKNANYAISVSKSASNTVQSFLLAKGATGFNQTITLKNEVGDSVNLSVGDGFVKFGKAEYSLSLVNGALILNRGKSSKQLSISEGVADADDGWNNDLFLDGNTLNSDVCGNGKGIKITNGAMSSVQIDEKKAVRGLEGFDNYVGFGDDADYAKLSLMQPAKLNFTVDTTGNVKFVVYSLTNKNGKWVRKEVKSLTVSLKKENIGITHKDCSTGEILLKRLVGDTGTGYYLSVQSTDAKSGGMAWYKVNIDSTVCASDYGTNDKLLMDKKTVNPDLKTTAVSGSGKLVSMEVSKEGDSVEVSKNAYGKTYNSFVGFGDEVDYAQITFSEAGTCSFSIDVCGTEKASAKFTVYSLTRSESSKAWTKKTLATKTVKITGDHIDDVRIEGVGIDAATGGNVKYFVSMQVSNDTAKKGEVYYRTTASFSSAKSKAALTMPESAETVQDILADGLSMSVPDTQLPLADAGLPQDDVLFRQGSGLLA